MRVHFGGGVFDKLVDKHTKGGAGVGVEVEGASVAPGEKLGEKGAVFGGSEGGIGVTEFIHETGEETGVRVADKEEAKIGWGCEEVEGFGGGVVGEVA